jgi:hypothetical protein
VRSLGLLAAAPDSAPLNRTGTCITSARVRSAVMGTRLRAGAAALGLLVSVPAGAAPIHAAAPPSGCRVIVVGDSLTVGMRRYGYGTTFMGAALPGVKIALSGQRGRAVVERRISDYTLRRTTPGITVLGRARAQAAGIWVIELGTNDEPNMQRFQRYIRQVMTLANHRSVIWVNVARPRTSNPPANDPVNMALVRASRQRANLRVVDWASLVTAHRGWVAKDSMRIHPNGAGSRALSRLISLSVYTLTQPQCG